MTLLMRMTELKCNMSALVRRQARKHGASRSAFELIRRNGTRPAQTWSMESHFKVWWWREGFLQLPAVVVQRVTLSSYNWDHWRAEIEGRPMRGWAVRLRRLPFLVNGAPMRWAACTDNDCTRFSLYRRDKRARVGEGETPKQYYNVRYL